MNFSLKMSSKIVGVLFIVAAVASVIGLLLYDPILNLKPGICICRSPG